MPINLKQNTSLLATEDTRIIVGRFLQKLKLTCFNYGRYYSDGARFNLSNRSDWIQHFYQYDYHNVARLERHPSCYSSCFLLWDHWQQDFQGPKVVMKDSENNFNIAHGLSIIKCNQKYYDIFDYGTSRDNSSINNFYLSNIDLFENFSLYFLEQAKRLIKKAYKDRFHVIYDDKIDIYSEYPDTLLHAKKLTILNKYTKPILNCRELACIECLAKGKTVTELATFLNISHRTAEKRIIRIKDKLDCQTLFQLGNKISKLGLDKLLVFSR